jgi:hypothetical protein
MHGVDDDAMATLLRAAPSDVRDTVLDVLMALAQPPDGRYCRGIEIRREGNLWFADVTMRRTGQRAERAHTIRSN